MAGDAPRPGCVILAPPTPPADPFDGEPLGYSRDERTITTECDAINMQPITIEIPFGPEKAETAGEENGIRACDKERIPIFGSADAETAADDAGESEAGP